MLINNTLYTILVILLTALVLVGVTWFVRKKLKNSQSFVIGFFLAGVVFVGLLFGVGRLYIIDAEESVDTYRAFGTFSFEMADGNTITATLHSDSVMVINNSDDDFVLEELIYSNYAGYGGGMYEVDAWSCRSYSLAGNRIHYFFDDEIDESISTRSNEPVSRYWLHQ